MSPFKPGVDVDYLVPWAYDGATRAPTHRWFSGYEFKSFAADGETAIIVAKNGMWAGCEIRVWIDCIRLAVRSN